MIHVFSCSQTCKHYFGFVMNASSWEHLGKRWYKTAVSFCIQSVNGFFLDLFVLWGGAREDPWWVLMDGSKYSFHIYCFHYPTIWLLIYNSSRLWKSVKPNSHSSGCQSSKLGPSMMVVICYKLRCLRYTNILYSYNKNLRDVEIRSYTGANV